MFLQPSRPNNVWGLRKKETSKVMCQNPRNDEAVGRKKEKQSGYMSKKAKKMAKREAKVGTFSRNHSM